MSTQHGKIDRRGFIEGGCRLAGVLGVAGFGGFLASKENRRERYVWQIDPDKCTACRNCETHCVLDTSAVKAVQFYKMCGFCDICPGYLVKDYIDLDTGAENHLCPTDAVERKLAESQSGSHYFAYNIDDDKCIGCGKCVEGCATMNGSLYLQIRHDRCVNCNECAIAAACPTQAIQRVPADSPYLLKEKARRLEKEAENA